MKAFLLAILALAVLTVGAEFLLEEAGFSSAEVYQTDNVRLGE